MPFRVTGPKTSSLPSASRSVDIDAALSSRKNDMTGTRYIWLLLLYLTLVWSAVAEMRIGNAYVAYGAPFARI